MARDVADHFDDRAQQDRAALLGLWVFLVTEILFFGGLFTGYAFYRASYGAAFAAASGKLDLAMGTVNTGVLLASSLTMALAVHAAGEGRRKLLAVFLGLTLLLGMAFLGIKGLEYAHKIHEGLVPGRGFLGSPEPGFELFFSFYFIMTGMHALHMVAGLGILAALLGGVVLGRRSPRGRTVFELAGLYWHFVDIVWIFLFPLLYLLGGHRP